MLVAAHKRRHPQVDAENAAMAHRVAAKNIALRTRSIWLKALEQSAQSLVWLVKRFKATSLGMREMAPC